MKKAAAAAEISKPEVANFTQVFRGENQSEFWLLRIGQAERNEYLFKMNASFEHPWNKKIFLLQKELGKERADWHMKYGSNERFVVCGMKKAWGQNQFEVFLEGKKVPVKAQLDEILSRKIPPQSFLEEYLNSLSDLGKQTKKIVNLK